MCINLLAALPDLERLAFLERLLPDLDLEPLLDRLKNTCAMFNHTSQKSAVASLTWAKISLASFTHPLWANTQPRHRYFIHFCGIFIKIIASQTPYPLHLRPIYSSDHFSTLLSTTTMLCLVALSLYFYLWSEYIKLVAICCLRRLSSTSQRRNVGSKSKKYN